MIIYDRDPALGGAWAALRARYRARDAKVNNRWQPRCATCLQASVAFLRRYRPGLRVRPDGTLKQKKLSKKKRYEL